MSSEDSLSEMNVAPQRLMPKIASTAEHHRILSLSAIQHGNSISTFKAHKVRQDALEEKVEEFDDLKEAVWELKTELATQRSENRDNANKFSKATSDLSVLVADLGLKYTVNSTGAEIKKVALQGLVAVLIAAIAAYGGYVSRRPDTPVYQAPTHQQSQETARKIEEFDPDNAKRVNR